MVQSNETGLLVRVARLYYEQAKTQTEIAEQLDLSQATVSRLLKRAKQTQIVRTSVTVPLGVFPDIEEALQAKFGLKQAVIVDTIDDESHIVRDLGSAAAFYLESTIRNGDIIGISSWSASLLAMVDVMHRLPQSLHADVVQILGGMGRPGAEIHATQLTQRLAALTNGTPILLSTPGLANSEAARVALLQDPFAASTLRQFDRISVALVGIGSLEPSQMLAASGNTFLPHEVSELQEKGAVGDICLRFYDQTGQPVFTELNKRVIAMELRQLQTLQRSIGIAGGRRKLRAIAGALAGKWINVLITDRYVGESLLKTF